MTTSTQTKNTTQAFEAAFEQATHTGEQFFAAARKAGSVYLDSYEQAVERGIELELKVADLTQQDWLKTIVETQADFTRELTTSYTSTARGLLK